MICIIDNKIYHFDELPENYPTDRITDYIDEEEFFYYNQDLTSFTVRDGKFVPLKPLKVLQERSLSAKYIPSETASIKALFCILPKTLTLDAETKLSVSGLYDTWAAGKYEAGDIRNHAGQTWECIQAHDNAVYPDITPDNPQTWHTFWKPLHGKSAETARPWVKPQFGTTDMYHAGEYMIYTDGKKQFGTTDMYLAGEYMIWTDGKKYKCLSDTVYSPEEYSEAWEVQS